MTLLLPVLLERVPGFYVPGAFDAELNRYSRTADSTTRRELERKRRTAPAPAAVAPGVTAAAPLAVPSTATATTPAAPASVETLPAGCVPADIGRDWLARFDGAIERRDAAAVVALFSVEADAELLK